MSYASAILRGAMLALSSAGIRDDRQRELLVAINRLERLESLKEDDVLSASLKLNLTADTMAFRLGAIWAEHELRRLNGYANDSDS